MLTFRELRMVSATRAMRWVSTEEWSPLEWGGAMAGEAGEACNAAKKIKRIDGQIAHHDNRLFGQNLSLPEQRQMYAKKVAQEVADTVIYGDLMCSSVGEVLEEHIMDVFNKKSEEYGFPERLTGHAFPPDDRGDAGPRLSLADDRPGDSVRTGATTSDLSEPGRDAVRVPIRSSSARDLAVALKGYLRHSSMCAAGFLDGHPARWEDAEPGKCTCGLTKLIMEA